MQPNELPVAAEPPSTLQDMLLMAFNIAQPDAEPPQNPHHAFRPPMTGAIGLSTVILRRMATALAWKQWVAKQLDAELVGNLFLAAAARRNWMALSHLEDVKPETVPAAVFEAALSEAVQQCDTDWLGHLCNQGAAKACSTGVAISLLLAAFTQGYSAGARQLLELPGLQQRLEPCQVASLLLAALQSPATAKKRIAILLKLSAAQRMPWDNFKALLHAALRQHATGASVYFLVDLVQQLQHLHGR
jgi:hypothetical protein